MGRHQETIDEWVAKPLTPKQQKIYDFIVSFWLENKFSPTFREICEAIGDCSPANTRTTCMYLQGKELIDWLPGQSRTITVAKMEVRMKPHPLNEVLNEKITIDDPSSIILPA